MTFMRFAITVFLGAQILGCSSAPKETSSGTNVPGVEPGYLVRGRYPAKTPVWAEDFEAFKKANDGKGMTYFMGESGDTNDRAAGCELASLSAKRRIAEQIAQLVMSRIGSGKAGVLMTDKDSQAPSGLGTDFQDLVASESIAVLSGVQEYGKTWEERDYTLSGGRKRVYLCETVVMIDDNHMREAIRRTGKQVGPMISDPVAKGLVDSAFQKLDQGIGKAVATDEIKAKAE